MNYNDRDSKTVDIFQAAEILGEGVSAGHVHARIRRGSLKAYKDDDGKWRIPITELDRIKQDLDVCGNCTEMATRFIIIKYHNHVRVEFKLCENCASKAEKAYSKQGGVLEIVSFPINSEGWLKS